MEKDYESQRLLPEAILSQSTPQKPEDCSKPVVTTENMARIIHLLTE